VIEQATSETISPTSDERMLSALAHFFGIIGSLIIYVIQKDKSRFVRFQAAQALAFDLITTLFLFVLFFCFFGVMFIGMFGTMFAGMNNTAQSENFSWLVMFPALFPFGVMMCIVPFSMALFITRIVAAISVLNGNNFHYPVLGRRVEQFLTE
jgi:uncharacterized Tic20 family protein